MSTFTVLKVSFSYLPASIVFDKNLNISLDFPLKILWLFSNCLKCFPLSWVFSNLTRTYLDVVIFIFIQIGFIVLYKCELIIFSDLKNSRQILYQIVFLFHALLSFWAITIIQTILSCSKYLLLSFCYWFLPCFSM